MKRVNSLWTLVPWVFPWWGVVPWIRDNVERAVFDGMTRHEWFQAQVDEYHAAERERRSSPAMNKEKP